MKWKQKWILKLDSIQSIMLSLARKREFIENRKSHDSIYKNQINNII